MFKTPKSRYIGRGVLATLCAAIAVAGTIWIANPYVQILSAAALVGGGYLGLGAVTPVEPFVGANKPDVVEVPAADVKLVP
jgi:hypothetical protein